MSLIESYASIILHTGCAIPPVNEQEGRKHKLEECRIKDILLKRAYKHQKKLQKNGLTIGEWAKRCPCNGGCHNGHTPTCSDECYDVDIFHAPIDQR